MHQKKPMQSATRFVWMGICLALTGATRAESPYPPSPVIANVRFDFATHERRAPGSDNYQGVNVWGGKNGENAAKFGGKSFALIFTGTGANDSWNMVRDAFSLVQEQR